MKERCGGVANGQLVADSFFFLQEREVTQEMEGSNGETREGQIVCMPFFCPSWTILAI